MNIVTNRERGCLSCRLISGGGLIGMGLYVSYCSRQVQRFNRFGLLTIGAGLSIFGVARLLDLPPFKDAFPSSSSQ